MLLAFYITAIAIVLLLLAVAWVWYRKRKMDTTREPNYRTYFIVSLAWLPVTIGCIIAFWFLDISFVVGIPLLAINTVFLSIGLANRDKWKKAD